MNRKILIGILILIVVVGSVGYYMYSKKVQNYAEGEPDINVTAKELIEAFDKDTASAVRRFMDKKIRVTGTIKSFDSSAVVLAEEGIPSSVVLGLDERNKKSISQLKVGEAATLQGKLSGYDKSSGDPEDMLASLGTTINIDYAGIITKNKFLNTKQKHHVQKNLIALAGLVLFAGVVNAQDRYFTKTGKIEFFSKAPLEDIEAKNKTVTAILDTKTGAMQFSVQMKGFEFQKALMQEHFNENYVESNKFPKADFKGSVANNSAVNYNKEGTYNVTVKGKLTIHGVTKDVEAPGSIKVDGGKIDAVSTFNIQLSDYNISIPSVVKDKISNSIKITIDTKLEPLKS